MEIETRIVDTSGCYLNMSCLNTLKYLLEKEITLLREDTKFDELDDELKKELKQRFWNCKTLEAAVNPIIQNGIGKISFFTKLVLKENTENEFLMIGN
jgi:hypothetical protein